MNKIDRGLYTNFYWFDSYYATINHNNVDYNVSWLSYVKDSEKFVADYYITNIEAKQ
mgnify:CR=1 FL=1